MGKDEEMRGEREKKRKNKIQIYWIFLCQDSHNKLIVFQNQIQI